MKLLTLRILPKNKEGWRSRRLVFGEDVTQLFSEKNGCGKTPLLQSIVFAFGYPVIFRDDIASHCGAVRLTVSKDGKRLSIWRDIGPHFRVRIRGNGKNLEFTSSDNYADYMLAMWGMERPVVTNVREKPSALYLEHILPIFYLDQDNGYSTPYHPPSKFIKDQYPEAMRTALGLAPRNPFHRKKIVAELTARIDSDDEAIARHHRLFDDLNRRIGPNRRAVTVIDSMLQAEADTLDALRSGADPLSESDRSVEENLASLAKEIRSLRHRRSEVESQIGGLERIRHEIEIEADTLSLNEEARRVFLSFTAVCAMPGCGMFANSAKTYGKSLLYLRDQLKDLGALHNALSSSSESLDAEIKERLEMHNRLVAVRDAERGMSESEALIGLVSEATSRIIDLQREKQIVESIDELEVELVALMGNRDRLLAEREGLAVGRGSVDADLLRARTHLQNAIVRWMDVLKTNNVSRQVVVDADFQVMFGAEKLKAIKGSTLTRVVLAIRTATIEVLMEKSSFSPRFFVLDTPRQQDIDRNDFSAYIDALKAMAASHHVQVVFSSTDYHYRLAERDIEWVPDFPGEEHAMFLG